MDKFKNKNINYLDVIIKENPKLAAGRKNYIEQNNRIKKNILLIKEFKKEINKNEKS